MANGVDIAKAYVQIIPSADGISGKLSDIMDGEADKAGKSAGGKFSGALGKVLKTGGAIVGAFTGATTALGGALVKGAGDVAAYGDSIDKMSQKMGLSATAYQEWDAIMQHSGTSIESMKSGMKTLANAVESGNGAFERIGLSMDEIAGMNNEELFAATIAGLQNVENETERTYLAGQLLGRGATELGALLNTSAEDTEAMRQRVHELGGVMSDEAVKSAAKYQDSLQDMQTAIGGLKNRMLGDLLPGVTQVMDGLTEMFTGGDGLPQISEGINSIVDNISAALPQFIDAGGKIVLSLSEAVLANLPTLVSSFVGLVGQLTEGLLTPDNIALLVDASLQITLALVDGLIDALPILIDGAVTLATSLATKLSDPDTLGKMIKAAWEIIKALASGIIKAVPQILAAAAQVLSNLFTTFKQAGSEAIQRGREILNKIGEGFSNAAKAVLSWGQGVVDKIVSGIRGAISSVVSIGRNIVEGIWNGISGALSWIKNKISGWVGNVMSFIKGLFGISSPSKWAEDMIGHNIGLGVGIGFVDSMGEVERMMKDALPTFGDLLPNEIPLRPAAAASYGTRGTAALAPQYSYGGVTIVIQGREKDADTLARELQQALERRANVWA